MRRLALLGILILFLPNVGRSLFAHCAEPNPADASWMGGTNGSDPDASFVVKLDKLAVRVLLGQVPRAVGQRLDLTEASAASRPEDCSELTKPDSLRIFLIGTPHNHRAPPA